MNDSKNEEKVLSKLKKAIDYIKNHFWLWFFYTLSTSLIVLVVCSLVFRKNIQLQDINSWVGIILGIVALVATVFSVLLSFYSYDKQNELNEKSIEINAKTEDMLNQILLLTKETNESVKISNNNNKTINAEKTNMDLNNLQNEFNQLIK